MSFLDRYEYIQGEFTDISREEMSPAGTSDVWMIDTSGIKIAGFNIELWDADVDGTKLLEGTDYSLVFRDSDKSSSEGQSIWAGYNIITPEYQGIPLYLTIRMIGGYTKFQGATIKAIDTDGGDVDAGLPPGTLGAAFEVWNTGTSGNHVTGLPDGINLGDGKGLKLRYVDGWRYEDNIIEEYTASDQHVTKWAGGRMEITAKGVSIITTEAGNNLYGSTAGGVYNGEETIIFAFPFISVPIATASGNINNRTVLFISIKLTDSVLRAWSRTSSNIVIIDAVFIGHWK